MVQEDNQRGSSAFLIAEYNQISEETRRLRSEGLNRLNFLITLTSTIIAGLVVLSQSSLASTVVVQVVSIGALSFLTLLGWNLFRFVISRDISTDLNIRATGRIHRYFMDHDPSLHRYLMWQDHDEPTVWVTDNTSNLRSTVQTIVSLVIALDIGITVSLVTTFVPFLLCIGVMTFMSCLVFLNRYAQIKFNRANEKARKFIRFPKMNFKDKNSIVNDELLDELLQSS